MFATAAPAIGTSTGLIEWESTYPAGQTYEISYSGDGGTTWQRLGTTTNLYFTPPNWTTALTEQALINVAAYRGVGDRSDAPFAVRTALRVTSPQAGETLTAGRSVDITWATQLSTGLTYGAEVSYDGGQTWTAIITPDTATSRITWTVAGPATTHARIRVAAKGGLPPANTIATAVSEADFTIVVP